MTNSQFNAGAVSSLGSVAQFDASGAGAFGSIAEQTKAEFHIVWVPGNGVEVHVVTDPKPGS